MSWSSSVLYREVSDRDQRSLPLSFLSMMMCQALVNQAKVLSLQGKNKMAAVLPGLWEKLLIDGFLNLNKFQKAGSSNNRVSAEVKGTSNVPDFWEERQKERHLQAKQMGSFSNKLKDNSKENIHARDGYVDGDDSLSAEVALVRMATHALEKIKSHFVGGAMSKFQWQTGHHLRRLAYERSYGCIGKASVVREKSTSCFSIIPTVVNNWAKWLIFPQKLDPDVNPRT